MVLFKTTPILAELEILNAVGTAGDALQRRKTMHTRTADFVKRLPIDQAGRTLHEQEGLTLFVISHLRMRKRSDSSRMSHRFARSVPEGIAVPADHVQILGHGRVIQSAIEMHKVGRDRNLR